MKEVFGVPQIINEARDVARSRTKPGKKPGIFWLFTVLIGVVLLIVTEVASSVPVFGYIVLRMLREGITDFSKLTSGDMVMIITLYSLIIVTIMFCLYVKIFEKRKVRTLGFVKKGFILQYIIGIVVGFGIFSLAVLIGYLTGAVQLNMESSIDYGMIALYSGGWLIQGMEEEVMCRGFLLTSLSRRYPIPVGVVINSVAFAALHLLNPGIGVLPFINLVLFGIFASIMFVKTGNIWMCSAVHSIWNLVQGNFYGISVSGNQAMPSVMHTTFVSGKEIWNGGSFGLEGGLCVTAVLVAGSLLLCLIPSRNQAAKQVAADA